LPHPRGEIGELMAQLNRTAESLERQRAAIEDLNQKLRQSQKMEAVGQLTGGVAHDFNNLLTVILGSNEMLAQSLAGNPELRGIAELAVKAAERGAELTNRLLAFGRRQALSPTPSDINRLLAGMEKLLRRTLGEHVDIEMVQSGGLWKAMVDTGQIENAILNLCLNARDAMPQGGRLTIETANVRLDAAYADRHSELEPGQYVMVAVSDTGTGMDAATLERAFEPFFTTKEVGKGSGLGLSMVYGFIKQSKGHVRIYSEQGQGTTVKLYLPRAYTGKPTEEEASGGVAARRGDEKILLVEDDELVRDHVSAQLKSLGYDVVVAANGPEALDLIRRSAFDLLFTDIVMPGGMNGRQLADEARKLRPTMPVLFTSGYTENAIVHHGRLDPGVHLLQKPYRRQELAAKLRAVLDRDAVAEPPPA
ncbi:MAG: response regulator, partial [Rhodospirillales bacterium]|nr:response regulator [Rhodospirillales bacterium]